MTPESQLVAARDKKMVSVSESRDLVYQYRGHGSRSASDGTGNFFAGTWEIAILVRLVMVFGIACFDPLTMSIATVTSWRTPLFRLHY